MDERIQQNYCKADGDENTSYSRMLSLVQQQVRIGYFEETTKFEQFFPTDQNNKVQKTGYYVVYASPESYEITSTLVRKPDCDLEYNELWPNTGDNTADFLVIHQGLLDKWCTEHSKSDKKEATKHLIRKFKQKFPFVLVTSGRGRPDEVPPATRFIPVSSFATDMQQDRYEKFTLIVQAFSILGAKK